MLNCYISQGKRVEIGVIDTNTNSVYYREFIQQNTIQLIEFIENSNYNVIYILKSTRTFNLLLQQHTTLPLSTLTTTMTSVHDYLHSLNYTQLQLLTIPNILYISNTDSLHLQQLFNSINYTSTTLGKSLLEQYILQPFTSTTHILHRHSILQQLLHHSDIIPTVQSVLCNTSNLYRILDKHTLTVDDIGCIQTTITTSIQLHTLLLPVSTTLATTLSTLYTTLSTLHSTLDSHITHTTYEYTLNSTLSPELTSITNSMNRLVQLINTDYTQLHYKNVKLEKHDKYNWVYKTTRSTLLSPDTIILSTQKSGILFYTPTTFKLNSTFTELQQQYTLHSTQLLLTLTTTILHSITPLLSLSNVLSELDVYLSLSTVTLHYSWSIPTLSTHYSCTNALHPLVSNCIPNSLFLSSFAIVTGANCGGKSTFLRLISTLSILAQIGCSVPCTACTVPVLDSIYTRIGASDVSSLGMSTFSMEMVECVEFVNGVCNEVGCVLVVIDEVGRGTGVGDGWGLCCGLGEWIRDRCNDSLLFCVMATHFDGIGQRLGVEEWRAETRVCNDGIRENSNSLLMTYKILPGSSVGSFGLEVGSVCGFPESVLLVAESVAESVDVGWSDEEEAEVREALRVLVSGDGVAVRELVERLQGRVGGLEMLIV